MLESLSSLMQKQNQPLGRDLSAVNLERLTMTTPLRATVLGQTVWTFRIETRVKNDKQLETTTRNLEDFAWLRRALGVAVPGVIVPPGPLVSYANSRDSSGIGEIPFINEQAEILRSTAQIFCDRLLDHPELQNEPLVKSFALDQPEGWESRKKEAEAAMQVSPAMVQLGAKYALATESMGITSVTNNAAARINQFDRAEMEKAMILERWVVRNDDLLDNCEKAVRIDADYAVSRSLASLALLDLMAQGGDISTQVKATLPGGGDIKGGGTSFSWNSISAIASSSSLSNQNETNNPETTLAALEAQAEEKRRARAPHVAILRELADLRAYLNSAREAISIRDTCRRESWTARRHCAEKKASFAEREAQIKLAKSREEDAANSTNNALQSFSLAAQSAFANYHADTMLATKQDVHQAEKLDGLLRHRFDVCKIRLYAQMAWLQSTWNNRCRTTLRLFTTIELERRKVLVNELQSTLTAIDQSNALILQGAEPSKPLSLPTYSPPDFATELQEIADDEANANAAEFFEPKRSTTSALLTSNFFSGGEATEEKSNLTHDSISSSSNATTAGEHLNQDAETTVATPNSTLSVNKEEDEKEVAI
mmetsp:Transcript_1859/g.2825  ORF Transcript_1859/g.2825 Transcript_1859/m.2825 type:complete len:599 (+) Transcript_1859:95-1891(+)